MKIKKLFTESLFLLLLLSAVPVMAANDVMVSPPPIPWYEFKEEQADLRISAAYASISGDDLDIAAASIGFLGRIAFTNVFAIDAGFSYIGGGGDAGTNTDVTLHNWTPSGSLELQPQIPVKMIFFAGFSVPLTLFNVKSDSVETEVFTAMYGPHFGVQAAIDIMDFELTPFVKLQFVGGSYTTTVWTDYDTITTTGDVDTFMVPTFGFDIVYKPLNLILSSLLQIPQGESDYKTILITLSYNFNFNDDNEDI